MHYLKTLLFLSVLLGGGLLFWRALLTDQARAWIGWRFAVVVPIVAVGLYAPNLWVYYGAILAAMVTLPRTRIEAAGLFIFLALLLPLTSYDVQLGGTYLMRLEGRMVGALGLLPAFRFAAAPRVRAPGGGAIAAIVLLFMIVQIVIDTRIADTSGTNALRNVVVAILSFGLPYWLIAGSAGGRTDLRLPLFYLAAAGFVLSIVAGFEMIRHWPLYQTIESNLGTSSGLSKTLALRGGLLRAPGPFFESTTFGMLLALTTICIAGMRSIFRSPAAHLAAIAIGGLGCFSTLARNAWIGAVLGLIVAGLYRGRVGKAAGAGILVAVAAAGLILAAPNSGTTASLLGKGDTTAATTATYRQDLWTKSIPLVRQSPWIGTPYDRVRDLMQFEMTSGRLKVDYVNSYLYFAVATGLAGLAVFLAFVLYPPYALFAARRRLLPDPVMLETATALFAAQVALIFMVFGTSFFERVPLFAILLVAMTRRVIGGAGRSGGAAGGDARPERPLLVIDPLRPTLLPAGSDRRVGRASV